ncbi:MAG: hypothetical protein KGY99_04245 [Phycisphaerae bacterium]|nr:hypothetical protein [Phycisphaerae bacterium]
MTTLQPQRRLPAVETLLRKLAAVQARRWTFRVLTGAAVTVTVVLTCLLATGAIAGYVGNAGTLLWWLRAAGGGAVGAALAWFVLRAVLWRQNTAQTARFVEQRIPSLRNDLINAVLLVDDRDQPSPELVGGALSEASRRAEATDLSASVSAARCRKAILAAGLAVAALLAFAAFQPGPLGRGLGAVLLGADAPGASARSGADIDLLGVGPGNAVVFPGDRVKVSALVGGAEVAALSSPAPAESPDDASTRLAALVARLEPRIALRNGRTLPLGDARLREGALKLTGVLTSAAQDALPYAVLAGGRRRPTDADDFFMLRVVDFEGIDLALDYPDYLGRTDEALYDVAEGDRGLRVPIGTKVTLTVRLTAPVPAAVLRLNGQSVVLRAGSRSTALHAGFVVRADGGYRVEVHDADGDIRLEAPADGSAYPIRAVPDAPPRVTFQHPAQDVPVAVGASLETRIAVSDDHGLTEAAFYTGRKGAEPQRVHSVPLEGPGAQRLSYTFALPADAAEGDTFVYYATATDNRHLPGVGGPQTAQSRRYEIRVQDATRLAAEKARRYDALRRRLLAILAQQQAQRLNTALARQAEALDAVRSFGGQIVRGQQRIKMGLSELADTFDFDSEMVALRGAIGDLAADEAHLAIAQARVVEGLDALPGRGEACGPLGETQEDVIDALERMLAIMPSLAGRKAPETPGDDLPADVHDTLAELKAELERFIDEQRKVVEAQRKLAKTPVDDFTDAQAELLDALKAVQDKWETFLDEQVADLSKLAEQDFANPAMLAELMSIRHDVTMAADALEQKAVEIATAFENNGIENAETLTANIEKWLPDTPDREQWVMEAPPDGEEAIEQPELPTELEDLVGDLLEQEEALFDEMQDITSTYMISGDEAIGWDALDGPISNMNAQGVTGNQLPNTSELSGRSGEGRTGKSSGEFVQDEAVGKGGRRTPTRLTGDPYQAGQVDDSSTDPPGGATGGGKLSGAGAEGLEGPVPPPQAEQLERLAGKQAVIVNRAERIQARFQVGDYAGFKFLEAITLMNRVRDDLAHRRYRNALRTHDRTIRVLRQTQTALSGQADVTVDTAGGMPKRVQADISDASGGELPAAYRDALQQYYRRLSDRNAGR